MEQPVPFERCKPNKQANAARLILPALPELLQRNRLLHMNVPLQWCLESNLLHKHMGTLVFTLAGVPRAFITSQTLALAHGNHPLAISWAVDAWRCWTDGILHADSFHLFESICYCLWERRQALHRRRTGFVVHSGGEQRNARAHVLEGQVEAPPGQRPHGPRLCVDLQNTAVCDLIGGDGGHFTELAFTEVGAHVGVCFGDVKVEGFFAGDRGTIESVAVPHDKAELHRHTRNPRAPLDERGA